MGLFHDPPLSRFTPATLDALHLRQRADLDQRGADRPARVRGLIAGAHRVQVEGHHPRRRESGPLRDQATQRLHEQPRADEQDQGERELPHDQHLAKPHAARRRPFARGASRSAGHGPRATRGARPHRTPVITLTTNAKANTRASTRDERFTAARFRGQEGQEAARHQRRHQRAPALRPGARSTASPRASGS